MMRKYSFLQEEIYDGYYDPTVAKIRARQIGRNVRNGAIGGALMGAGGAPVVGAGVGGLLGAGVGALGGHLVGSLAGGIASKFGAKNPDARKAVAKRVSSKFLKTGAVLGGLGGAATGGAVGITYMPASIIGGALTGAGVGAARGAVAQSLRNKNQVLNREIEVNKKAASGLFVSRHRKALAQARIQQAQQAQQNLVNYRAAIAQARTPEERAEVRRRLRERSRHINNMYGANYSLT